jgi:hypothetical protein
MLEEENKRMREELEAMRRLLLMCVACELFVARRATQHSE